MTVNLPQALLLIGSDILKPSVKAKQFAKELLCFEGNGCGYCQACHFMSKDQHPDYHVIMPEGQANQIKIDTIRDIQSLAYRTPQLGHKRVIQINHADRMNTAAANALLKILEEPPPSLHFILVAPHAYGIPATILSRCQKQTIKPPIELFENYLMVGAGYEEGTPERLVFDNQAIFISDLIALHQQVIAVPVIAKKWAAYAMQPLLTLLILIYGQILKQRLLQQQPTNELVALSKYYEPDQINYHLQALNKLLLNNVSQVGLNQTMILESFLINIT